MIRAADGWSWRKDLGSAGSDRYAAQRYQNKPEQEGDSWRQVWIELQSLNPDLQFKLWPLDGNEDRYQISAEFVRLLD